MSRITLGQQMLERALGQVGSGALEHPVDPAAGACRTREGEGGVAERSGALDSLHQLGLHWRGRVTETTTPRESGQRPGSGGIES